MGFAAFEDQKYLNLETFKKSGQGVRTPVWFAADPATDITGGEARLFVYTIGVSGKVKRIRNNNRVKIAPCTIRGDVTGDWFDAQAQIVTGEEAARGMALIAKKYSPWTYLLNFFAKFRRRERMVMTITPA
jgi:PPOX class probable F420-dependent enzyme